MVNIEICNRTYINYTYKCVQLISTSFLKHNKKFTKITHVCSIAAPSMAKLFLEVIMLNRIETLKAPFP